MSLQGAPAKATLLPWLSKVSDNSGAIATCMSKVNVNNDQNKEYQNKKRNKKEKAFPITRPLNQSKFKKVPEEIINNNG